MVESICIVLILGIISIMFVRAHHKKYALATAPLIILPALHALSFLTNDMFHIVLSAQVRTGIDILGLALAAAMLGICSAKMQSRRSRVGYLLVCGCFTTALAIIFILNNYSFSI